MNFWVKHNYQVMDQYKHEEELLIEENVVKQVILYNDDVNTFDWVIKSLVEICKHESIQAEQCAHIVHYKGKCPVKHGSFDELKKYQFALSERGLTCEIE